VCLQFDAENSTLRGLGRQLLAAGTSVGANLEEARGAQSRRDFCAKSFVALKEAREALYWLTLIAETFPTYAGVVKPLITEADELVAILTSIAKKARSQ
jgi:four helix bundle protein